MKLKPGIYQFLVGCFASLGSFLYGYDLGVIAQVVASDSFITAFLQSGEATKSGTVVALFTAGGFFGAAASSFCDPLGRRGTISLGTLVFIIGGALQTGATSIGMLYAGRFIAGLGVGVLVMIIPLFQAEIAHPKIRGTVTALQQFFLGIGSLVASWVGYGCYVHWTGTGDSAQWRIPLGIQIVPALFLIAFIYLFPESPRWLIDHDKHERGLETLAKLHAHGNKEDAYVLAEYESIQLQITEEHTHAAKSYRQLFSNRSNRRRVVLACAIQAATQMTGVSAIQYFSPTIFMQIGISTVTTLLYQSINSIIALVAQAICIAIVDYTGRRWLEISGSILNSATFVIGAALIAIYPAATSNTSAHWAFIVASTWLFNFSFSATQGPLSWVIPAEIYNTATRTKGVSLAVMVSFAFNTMIGQVTPIAIAAVGWRFYLLFIICNLSNALFFYVFLPETKGLALEQMDDLFENSSLYVPGSHWRPQWTVRELAEEVEKGQHVQKNRVVTRGSF